MSSSDDDSRFPCPACGKRYRWKPDMAGRSAKCAGGPKLVVPITPPSAATGSSEISVAPPAAAATPPAPVQVPTIAPAAAPLSPDADSHCPSCASPLAPGAVLCINCGYNVKTGQKLAAVVVESDEDEED